MAASTMYLTSAMILAVICTVSSTDCYYENSFGVRSYKVCSDSCCGTYTYRYCCSSSYYYDDYSYSYDYYYSSVYVISTGAIVGAVIGSLVGLAIFITIIVVICRICCGSGRQAQPGTVVLSQPQSGLAVIQTSQTTTTQQAGMAYPPPQQGGNINYGYNPSMSPPLPASGYAGSNPASVGQMAPPPYSSK